MIKQGDCLELMREIPDGSVDAIICDPPFGTTDCYFDKRLPMEPIWEQFLRVTKRNAAIVLFSQMPFGSDLIQSQRKLFRYEWIWEKNFSAGFLNANKMPLRCHRRTRTKGSWYWTRQWAQARRAWLASTRAEILSGLRQSKNFSR